MHLPLLLALALQGDPSNPSTEPPSPVAEEPSTETGSPEQIAWYGTLQSALDEAARTERPIFLVAARPEYRSVPGFW